MKSKLSPKSHNHLSTATIHSGKNPFSEHLFEYRDVEKKKLIISLTLTVIMMVVEIVGGFLTRSIALISDAGHMFTHCFALGTSLVAIVIAQKPPCHHKTFGLYRAEILAAFINGLILILIGGVIIYEAIGRAIYPKQVLGFDMFVIALVGLIVNIASILILQGSQKADLNVKSVFYHMIGDAASSVVIVIAAIVISYTGWNIIDPLVSIGISFIIIYWAWGILKESTIILLEMAPRGLNVDMISDDLKKNFSEIKEIYNVHIWTIVPAMLVLSARIKLQSAHQSNANQHELISKIDQYLADHYKIIESTIQIVFSEESAICEMPKK